MNEITAKQKKERGQDQNETLIRSRNEKYLQNEQRYMILKEMKKRVRNNYQRHIDRNKTSLRCFRIFEELIVSSRRTDPFLSTSISTPPLPENNIKLFTTVGHHYTDRQHSQYCSTPVR